MIKFTSLSVLYVTLMISACSVPINNPATVENHQVQTAPQGPIKMAIFAGGCFWCIESDFEKLDGVIEVVSGYTGGHTKNPSYKDVTYKETGHYEAVRVSYDSAVISYADLLEYFWKSIDPTDDRGQFCDKGSSYRSAIFVTVDQKGDAQLSKAAIIETKPFSAPIVTPILDASEFYIAEEYHQDFYKKKPAHYNRYRQGCGRDKRLKQLWGQ